jgi:hypothetical protein
MTITERIEYDVQCLEVYFRKLFVMAGEASLQNPTDVATNESSNSFIAHSVTAFIRPDMVCNIYSLVDFWLPQLCSFHKLKSSLVLSCKDIKGASDLDAYYKYLTKVAALSLQNVQPSYNHLDNLRMVRNCVIHNGGHIKDEQQRIKFEQVPGIAATGSLVIIADSFIWDSLNHAKVYLCAVAQV